MFFPISNEAAMKRANDELSYYCNDLNLNCSRFIGGDFVKDHGRLRIYEWSDVKTPGLFVQVRVPHQRIGDITFGLIGKNVTLGSLTRTN